MDAFAKLARQDSDGKGNILIDVSLDGRFVAFNDASAQLWKADGRLLQMPTASLLDAHCYELRPQRDFFDSFLANFVCSGIKVHPRAAFVLICGTLSQDGGPTHVVLLVDTNAAGAKGMPRPQNVGSKDASECTAIVQRYDCIARLVDHARIAANELEVLQVSWHSHSASHFAVLTSDNAFSIFSIRQLSTPEQLFKISPLTPSATFSLVDLALDNRSSGAQELVAFTFGSTCAWDPLMVYFINRCGAVYALGPIAPFGSQLHTSAVLSLKRDCQDDPATLEWLREATGHAEVMLPLPQLLEKDMWRVSSTVVVQPHSPPGRVLALKGPLVAEAQRGEVFTSMCLLNEKLPRAQAAAAGVDGFSAVVLVGVPGAHAYVSVGLLPAVPLPDWSPGEPLSESDSSGHGAITHVVQRVTQVVPDSEMPPEPLEDLQLELPGRCIAPVHASASSLVAGSSREPTLKHSSTQDGPKSTFGKKNQEKVWLHAPRQAISAAAEVHVEPIVMMCLSGGFWKLYVHALPWLASSVVGDSATRPASPLGGASQIRSTAASVAASAAGTGTSVFGNGVASSVAASPAAHSTAQDLSCLSPRQQRLPRSSLQELAVPTSSHSSAVRGNGNGAIDCAGLRCVRLFWNALVGDVGIAQHVDGSLATFPADDMVCGSMTGTTSFWGNAQDAGGAVENAGSSSQVALATGGSSSVKKRGAAGDKASSSSVSFKADSSHLGSIADETLLESEQAMKAAYHIQRPKLPPVPNDLPTGKSESDVKKALDSDAAALMASGAAYCEHAHAVLLSRFQKVAQDLDKNAHADDVAEVQRRLEHIVKVNAELRERVNKASEAKQELTKRTDAVCNATLLNRSFQRCGLNSAEEAARTDLTRIEDSLEGLQRRIASATARVRPLMQPIGSAAAPLASENSTFSANTPAGSSASLPGAQSVAGSAGRPSNGAFTGTAAMGDTAGSVGVSRKRLGSVGPLRMTKSGKAYTGLGSGGRSADLFGGVDANNGAPDSTEQPQSGWSVRAQRGAKLQNLDGRSWVGGGLAGRVGGVELNSQQLEKLKAQVRVVEQQLDQIRQMESEVSRLCNEAVRQYG